MRRIDLLSRLTRARRHDGAVGTIARAVQAARSAVLRGPFRTEFWRRLSQAVGHDALRATQRRRSANAWMLLSAACAGLCLALWGAATLAGSVRVARRASGWVSVPGVILASAVVPCGDGSTFEPRISYRFDLDGSVRIGDRLALDRDDCGSRRRASALVARHPVDSAARVLYDAAAHGGSALEAGSESPSTWAGIAAFAALAAACLWGAARCVAALLRIRRQAG